MFWMSNISDKSWWYLLNVCVKVKIDGSFLSFVPYTSIRLWFVNSLNYYYVCQQVKPQFCVPSLCTDRVICMVVVRGVAGSKALRYFMNTLHSKKFQGHFRWLVLTQSCADDLITLSVCLWIYSLDQIISACPQQGWRTHPFLWYFAWKSDQKWKPLIWMYNKCINLKKTCRHHGFQWFPVIIHNQALLLSSQIVPSESLNLYHWSDAEAFGIRLCNRIHFVNRSFSVLSVVTEAFTQNKHTHTDCPLDIHVG